MLVIMFEFPIVLLLSIDTHIVHNPHKKKTML